MRCQQCSDLYFAGLLSEETSKHGNTGGMLGFGKARSTVRTTAPLPGHERNDRVCDMVVTPCGLVLIAEAARSRKGPAEAGGAAEGTLRGQGPAETH